MVSDPSPTASSLRALDPVPTGAECGSQVPPASGIEAARLLGNEFRHELLAAGFGDDLILALAEDWAAEGREGDFGAWARHCARAAAGPTPIRKPQERDRHASPSIDGTVCEAVEPSEPDEPVYEMADLIQRAKILTRRRQADLDAAVDRLVQNVLHHFHTDHREEAQARRPSSSDSAHSSPPKEDQGS